MRRRLVLALGVSALAPLTAFAQQRRALPRVGFLALESRETHRALDAIKSGLREHGYIEGQNIELDVRFAGDRLDRLRQLAGELIAAKVDVIVTYGTTATKIAAAATKTVPIVIATASIDPVAAGLAASLARPGGNVTGSISSMGEVTGKRLAILREMLPNLRTIAFLVNPDSGGGSNSIEPVNKAARLLNIQVQTFMVRAAAEFESTYAAMAKARVDALFVGPSSMFGVHVQEMVDLAARFRLPAMYHRLEYVMAGGLITYSPDFLRTYKNLGTYIDKILKGARPGDLPVEQPTTFELLVNMKTAKSLGLKIPQSILVQATKVIE